MIGFEITCKDLLGRIGTVKTKMGRIETPHMFPVINPLVQPIKPRDIRERFKCEAVMTNAYLLRKNFRERALLDGVHKILDFDGTIATDSGAYQLLSHGKIEIEPREILDFQEKIRTDIGVILDVPTGLTFNREHAKRTVEETLKRADDALQKIARSNILWVGPIQGGIHLDLLAYSAAKMSEKPFSIYALGSPTGVMERYMFDRLVDMIATVKMNMPVGKPLHLFGAGHPCMFPLAVALGCDLFDSASYAIYARDGRYMTNAGTSRLEELKYFPCSCPICSSYSPKELNSLEKHVKETYMAEHNLFVCMEEMRRIKQSITEGRLWELLEIRSRSHPRLLQALLRIGEYKHLLEKHSPSTKRKGIFFFDRVSLSRPEILRYETRLTNEYRPPRSSRILLLLPIARKRTYDRKSTLGGLLGKLSTNRMVHCCFCTIPYGVVPLELCETFPLAQTELALPPDEETLEHVESFTMSYLERNRYRAVVLHIDRTIFRRKLREACQRSCIRSKKRLIVSYEGVEPWSDEATSRLVNAVTRLLKELRSSG